MFKRLPLALALLSGSVLSAQGALTRPALGFHLSNLAGDLAMGFDATSPTFLKGSLAFRASADLALRQGNPIAAPQAMTSEGYGVGKLGVVGMGGRVAEGIRVYGEGGFLFASPKPSFSKEPSRLGGYGHFGFEFLLGKRGSYFIELGTVGLNAHADRQVGSPIYLNGFAVGTGMRIYL